MAWDHYRQVEFKATRQDYKQARVRFESDDAFPRRNFESDGMAVALSENQGESYVAIYKVNFRGGGKNNFLARVFATEEDIAERAIGRLRSILEEQGIEVIR